MSNDAQLIMELLLVILKALRESGIVIDEQIAKTRQEIKDEIAKWD